MQRHVILTLGRSGSNTLSDMLNQNPHVLNFGEVLGEWTQARRFQRRFQLFRGSDADFLDWMLYSKYFPYLANLFRSLAKLYRRDISDIKQYRNIKTIGIKEFSLNFERHGVGDYLLQHNDIKVIGLIRENIVDRFVSTLSLQNTGVVAARSGGAQNTGGTNTLRIDPATIVRRLEIIEHENRALSDMLSRVPKDRVLVIRYEDLFHDEAARDAAMQKAFAFLDVPATATKARMKKIIQAPLEELIENFDACRDALRGTPYEGLFQPVSPK